MFVKFVLVLGVIFVSSLEAARILGVFPYPSKSHAMLGQPIFVELAKRGHEVTFVSPFQLKDPPKGYRDILLTDERLFETYNNEMAQIFEVMEQDTYSMFKEMFDNCAKYTEYTIMDEAVQELLNSETEKFDLVFIDTLLNEALLGFGAHFNAKVIGMSTFGQVKYIIDMMHSPMPLSLVPHPFLTLPDRMTLSERFENVFFTLMEDFFINFMHYPLQEAIYNKYFKVEPSFKHMLKHSVSLMLLNTHFSINFPQAYLPNMIEIGGFHVKNETKPLPDDIKNFIDSAEHGVVYFSLGSNLKPSSMEASKRQAIIDALSKLDQKVIWKWDDESLEVDRSKFMVRKWLPQDDILAHENVKLFVTHGGLLSLIETIVKAKPVVGIPIFGDQMMNMARAELLGWGVSVAYSTLTEESLSNAIDKVLTNSEYSDHVSKISKRLKDQPQSPMELAIFWIEYVLRNEGAHYMQSAAQHLNWIEYYNLDIYSLFALVVFIVLFISIYCVRKVTKLFKSEKHNKKLTLNNKLD